MKLVVGLGNPGRRYDGTRHNVGFQAINELWRRHGQGKSKLSFHGEIIDAEIQGERCLLLSPHTLMNRSGLSVGDARDFYKLNNDELLVVCDDFNLSLGRLRLRPKGTAGGQKGLEDIIRRLGTDEFSRLRIGIGPVPNGWNHADYVLGRFNKDEIKEVELATVRAADAVAVWAVSGIATAMNQYNAEF